MLAQHEQTKPLFANLRWQGKARMLACTALWLSMLVVFVSASQLFYSAYESTACQPWVSELLMTPAIRLAYNFPFCSFLRIPRERRLRSFSARCLGDCAPTRCGMRL